MVNLYSNNNLFHGSKCTFNKKRKKKKQYLLTSKINKEEKIHDKGRS